MQQPIRRPLGLTSLMSPITLVLSIVRHIALRELKVDALARQTLVHLRVRVEPVVDAAAFLLVQHDLQNLAAILLCADAPANDFDGVDEIVEDGVVDGGEGS